MSVGDVRWVELAPRGGHAQAGRRPAIVVQSDAAAPNLPTALLIPLTTQLGALRFPGTVLVEADAQNGPRRHPVALVFQLTAVDRRFVPGRLAKVADATLRQLWAAFDELTGRL